MRGFVVAASIGLVVATSGSKLRGKPAFADTLLGLNDTAVVAFADAQWDCTTVSCTSRVPAGTFQPDYECAEFVARSLAHGGGLPGLGGWSPQSAFGSYDGYDLLEVTGLADALKHLGWADIGTAASDVRAGHAVMGGYGAPMEHAVVGVADGIIDAHNAARYRVSASSEFYGGEINMILAPPGSAAWLAVKNGTWKSGASAEAE